MLTDLLIHIIDIIESNLTLSYPIKINQLEQDGGISVFLVSGNYENSFCDKSTYINIPLNFLSKNESQETCINDLDNISTYLSELLIYPQNTGYQLANITISTYTNYVTKEDNGNFIYGCILDVKIYKER